MNELKYLLIVFLLISSHVAYAKPVSEELDAVLASPSFYKILFENEHVRVIKYTIEPGQRENWHTHPAKVAYVLSGGSLKITTDGGESFVVQEDKGSVRWLGAVGRHFGENVGNTRIDVVFVEVKGITEKTQNLNKYLQEETDSHGTSQ